MMASAMNFASASSMTARMKITRPSLYAAVRVPILPLLQANSSSVESRGFKVFGVSALLAISTVVLLAQCVTAPADHMPKHMGSGNAALPCNRSSSRVSRVPAHACCKPNRQADRRLHTPCELRVTSVNEPEQGVRGGMRAQWCWQGTNRMLGACTFFLGTQISRLRGNVRPSRSSTSSSTSVACAIHLAASVALRDCWFIENGSCARSGAAGQLPTPATKAPDCRLVIPSPNTLNPNPKTAHLQAFISIQTTLFDEMRLWKHQATCPVADSSTSAPQMMH